MKSNFHAISKFQHFVFVCIGIIAFGRMRFSLSFFFFFSSLLHAFLRDKSDCLSLYNYCLRTVSYYLCTIHVLFTHFSAFFFLKLKIGLTAVAELEFQSRGQDLLLYYIFHNFN